MRTGGEESSDVQNHFHVEATNLLLPNAKPSILSYDECVATHNQQLTTIVRYPTSSPTMASSSNDDEPPQSSLTPTESPLLPQATTAAVLACQFWEWYPQFSSIQQHSARRRKTVTIRSILLTNIPDQELMELEEFLTHDGLQLPKGAETLSSAPTGGGSEGSWYGDDDERDGKPKASDQGTEASDSDSDDEVEPPKVFHFPVLNLLLRQAIQDLGGNVMPKLNWSSPKDAVWANAGSMKCAEPGDIYLLLKSSDFCSYDVQRQAWKDCSDYPGLTTNRIGDETSPSNTGTHKSRFPLQLTLRKWCNINPSREFRCFVRQQELLAISQRVHSQHYPHLISDMPKMQRLLQDFFETYIQERFGRLEGASDDKIVSNYVFDAYVDQKDRVWILDFNIWAHSTDPLSLIHI